MTAVLCLYFAIFDIVEVYCHFGKCLVGAIGASRNQHDRTPLESHLMAILNFVYFLSVFTLTAYMYP